MNFVLKDAQKEHYKEIGHVMEESRRFTLPFIEHKYTKESFERFIENEVAPNFHIIVAFAMDGSVTGFVIFGSGWIEHLYLAPKQVGQGLGSKLLEAAIEKSEGVLTLWTFAENHRATSFYKKHGFKAVEESSENEENCPAIRFERTV